jgi:tetratricopeptide (TPR) repeat protein
MSEDFTFQDLLEEFQEDIFVGRTEQLALFENALTAPHPSFLILAVSGQGGVGKTTLLEQYQRRAAAHEALTAMVNEYQKTIPAVLADLAEQLEDVGGDFKHFNERYRKYRELQEQVEADPQAPKGMLDFALRSATRIGLRTLRRVPIAGEAADVLLTDEVEDRMVDETSTLAAYVARKFTNKDECVLLLETDAELTRHFITDFNALLKKHRVILCFDTYEETASVLDTWLRDLLGGKYGKFGGRVLFVIAGRYPLGQAWTSYRKAIRQIELNPFTEEEAREYLQSAGIVEEDQIAQLIALSERLPVLLAFLVSAPGDVPADVSGTAVERFLQSATPEQRETALVAAVPRYFNRDILTVILGEDVAPATFDWLSTAHFVRAQSDGWRYHNVVRPMMLDYLRLRSPDECRTKHAQLSAYHYKQIGGPDAPPRYDDDTWRSHRLEILYHNLSQEMQSATQAGVEMLLLSWLQYNDFARDINTTWKQASIEHSFAGSLVEWCRLLDGFQSVLFYEKSRDPALPFCEAALDLPGISPLAKSEACYIKGAIHSGQKQNDLAIAAYTNAVELNPENVRTINNRGYVYLDLQNYDAALADFNRLLELKPEDANTYHSLAITYESMRQYEPALAILDRALELNPEDAYTYRSRAIMYEFMRQYESALADYSRAIELAPEEAYAYINRAQIYRAVENYDAALADSNRAIELASEEAYAYAIRAQIYRAIGNYKSALADYGRAIELDPQDATAYYNRGVTYADLQQYDAALADYTQAIELNPQDTAAYSNRGNAYKAMQDYDAALADYGRAIELDPQLATAYYNRGVTYADLQQYDAALADYERVLELDPQLAQAYNNRGNTYYAMQDYEAALADYERALELDPQLTQAYNNRGNTYDAMRDYEAALADYERALELDPKDASLYYNRGNTYDEMRDYEAALADYGRALELGPQDATAYFNRAHTYAKVRDYDAALADYGRVIDLDPQDATAYYNTACAHALLNHPAEACAWLKKAIALDAKFRQMALTDSDFDPIRDTPCFQALMLDE